MSVVLNEREWAKNAIDERQLGRFPFVTLNRVARYYRQCENYSKQDVRDKLESFLLRCEPDAVLVRWSDTLDQIAKSSDRHPLIEIDGVDVTESELAIIRSLDKVMQQRVAFTLLCLAKYWNIVQPRNNNWVNTPDKEIMDMANVKLTVRRQSLLFYEMRNTGLISYSKRVDNLNIMVNFINDDSPVAMRITDFRNLGNQWQMYCGGAFIQCSHCGLTVKKKSNAQKYCSDCAAEKYIQDALTPSSQLYRSLRVPPS